MRGKKDNIEWEGNIIAAKCPYCGHTTSKAVTNAGVFNLSKCPKCERVYRIPEIRVYKATEKFVIKLNEFDYNNEVASDDMTPTERWAWWLNFWKDNGYYHHIIANIYDCELVQVNRYDGQDKPCDFKYYIFNKENEVILTCKKEDDKIVFRGDSEC